MCIYTPHLSSSVTPALGFASDEYVQEAPLRAEHSASVVLKPRSHCHDCGHVPQLPTINRRRLSRDKSGVQGPEFNFRTNVYDYSMTTTRMPANSLRFGSRFLAVSPRLYYDIVTT